MKQALGFIVVCLLALLVFWCIAPAWAQTATPGVTDQATFYWDTPSMDTLGGPVTVTGSEFGVWTGTVVDPNAAPAPLKLTPAGASGASGLSAIFAFQGLKGGLYTCGVRALSVSGTTTLKSAWSAPLSVTFSRPAAAPQNLRLTITVTP